MAQRNKNTDNKNLVVNQLVIKTLNRQTQDIDKWRTALKSADLNRRTLLYNLYEDILLDNRLSDAIDKRILAITNADLIFSVNDQEVEEINELMRSDAFRIMLREIMLAQFWGVTVLELDFSEGFNVYSIPRTHIRPDKKIIALNENDETGISYVNDPFLVPVLGDEKFGIILKTCPYVIYKRGNFGDWAQYAELFGMPFRLAKYDTFDEQTRILLTQAMEESGSASYAVIPKTGDIEYKDNKSTGDGGLYDLLRKACNEEITIGVLGQTLTTTQGDKGARSLGEVHLEVQEGKHANDRRFVATILNSLILPRLEARGFPVKGGRWSFPEKGETISLTNRITIDKQLDEIIEIEPDYFYETYGIPKPKDGGGKKAKPEPPQPPQQQSKEPKQKVKLSDDDAMELRDEKKFWKNLFSFFASAPGSGALKVGNRLTSNLSDAEFNDADFLKRFYDNQPDFDIPLFTHISTNLLKRFREGWAKNGEKLADIGFDYGFTSEVAQTAMEMNLFHFSAAKTLAECIELNKIFRESKSFDDFLKRAEPKHNIFNKTWAATEYDTAYLTAESSATYYRLKSQTDIFPYWRYRTQLDNRVRDMHRLLEGLILPANDPRWKKIYPPSDWNDRCYVVGATRKEGEKSDLKGDRNKADVYIESDDFKKAEAQGWGVNRAEAKQVFTANQMYVRKFPGKAAKPIAALKDSDYGLNGVSTVIKNASETIKKYEGTAREWFDKQNKQVGDAILTDYNGRHVILPNSTFSAFTGGKNNLTVYLDTLNETMAKPSEVWLRGEMLDEITMLRYYNNEAIVVVCQIENGTINRLKTFAALNATAIKQYRNGLLIQ